MELAEKKLEKVLDRNKTSEFKCQFNNIKASLGSFQEVKYKMKGVLARHNEDIGKTDE